jgi:hypothetical protein
MQGSTVPLQLSREHPVEQKIVVFVSEDRNAKVCKL